MFSDVVQRFDSTSRLLQRRHHQPPRYDATIYYSEAASEHMLQKPVFLQVTKNWKKCISVTQTRHAVGGQLKLCAISLSPYSRDDNDAGDV